jgi:hypothetical protein
MIAGSLLRFRAHLVFTVLVVLTIIVAAAALRLPSNVVPLNLGWATPASATPVPTIPPRINITRSEYEQALAKWQTQKIEEYEITVDVKALFGGTYTLRVSDYGNMVEQLAPVVRLASDLTAEEVEYLKRDTIEGMFEQIGEVFADIDSSGTPSGTESGELYMDEVRFDPVLGYPQHMKRWVQGWFDTDRDVTVTDLKIIKQGK